MAGFLLKRKRRLSFNPQPTVIFPGLYHGRHPPDQASLSLGLRKLGYDGATSPKEVSRRLLRERRGKSNRFVSLPETKPDPAGAAPGAGFNDGGVGPILGIDVALSRGLRSNVTSSNQYNQAQQYQQQAQQCQEKESVGAAKSESMGTENAKALCGGVSDGHAQEGEEGEEKGTSESGKIIGSSENLGGLTLVGFTSWSLLHGGRLQLVKDLVYVCLAEFGMQPAKPMQEKTVMQEIFQR